MKNRLSQVMVTQTLSVILFSEQKLTHFTNISCEIQQNVVELIKHLSKHLPLRFNLATNEISLTKSPLNPAQRGILGTEVTVEVKVRVMSWLLGLMRTSDAITVFVNKLANVCKQNP